MYFSQNLFCLGQVFEWKKPRPGYFIEKIKEIEFTFRAEYLARCKGQNIITKKFNFRKNPLENMHLPNLELLDLCNQIFEEKGYTLRNCDRLEEFKTKLEMLTCKYLSQIDFTHLRSQKEQEKLENNEKEDTEEEKTVAIKESEANATDTEEEEKTDVIIVSKKENENFVQKEDDDDEEEELEEFPNEDNDTRANLYDLGILR